MALNYTANTFKLYLGRRRSPQPKRQKSTQNFNQFVTYTQLDNILDKIWEELNELDGAVGTSGTLEASALRTLSGTTQGDTDLGTFTGATISDNTTTKTALQELETSLETKAASATVTEIDANVDDLITLSGVAENTTDLGTFSGTTITDNITIKAALQELETVVESLGGETAINNIYYVDLDNGDDGTAVEGDRTKPWLTVQAAITAADGSGDRCTVMIKQNRGNYSSQNFTVSGDVSVRVENYIPIPQFDQATSETLTISDWTNKLVDMSESLKQANRVWFGDVTIANDWAEGNIIEGFNLDTLLLSPDAGATKYALGTSKTDRQYFIKHIGIHEGVPFDNSADASYPNEVYGMWYNCMYFNLGTALGGSVLTNANGWLYYASANTDRIIGSYFQDCYMLRGESDRGNSGGFACAGLVDGDFIRVHVLSGISSPNIAGRSGQDFDGFAKDCVVGTRYAFAGLGNGPMSGTVDGCVWMEEDMTNDASISGTYRNCSVAEGWGVNSFTLTGTLDSCVWGLEGDAEMGTVGTGGLMINCRAYRCIANGQLTGDGSIVDCYFELNNGQTIYGVELEGLFQGCTIIQADGAGTQGPIDIANTAATDLPRFFNCTIIAGGSANFAISGSGTAANNSAIIKNLITNSTTGTSSDGVNDANITGTLERNNIDASANNWSY
jgi:hypothetical protein